MGTETTIAAQLDGTIIAERQAPGDSFAGKLDEHTLGSARSLARISTEKRESNCLLGANRAPATMNATAEMHWRLPPAHSAVRLGRKFQ
jgi:hypothetical protein